MHNRGEVDAPAVIFGELYLNVGTSNWRLCRSTRHKGSSDYGQGRGESQTEAPKIWETDIRGTFID